MKQLNVAPQDENQRADKYLLKVLPKATKSFLYKMLRKKNIKLNGEKMQGDEILKAGDQIQIYFSDETYDAFCTVVPGHYEDIFSQRSKSLEPLDIIFEDENILVVNKPQGLLSQPDGRDGSSLTEQIEAYWKHQFNPVPGQSFFKPGICNRLDRNTSGIVLSGKNIRALQVLNQSIKNHDVDKKYLTIVKGVIKSPASIRGYLYKNQQTNKVSLTDKEQGDLIVTHYKPLKCNSSFTLLQVTIETGKSHQIRLHLSSIGHPVIGDAKYGDVQTNRWFKQEFGLEYHLLHAYQYCLLKAEEPLHYLEGRVFEAPFPKILERIDCELFS